MKKSPKLPTIVKHSGLQQKSITSFRDSEIMSHTARTTDVSFSIPTLPPRCVQMFQTELWVNESGGRLYLPRTTVIVPRQAFTSDVLLSVAMVDSEMSVNSSLQEANLSHIVEHVLELRLEPSDVTPSKAIHIEIADLEQAPGLRYLVFSKSRSRFEKTLWSDQSSAAEPKFLNTGPLRLNVHKPGAIELLRLNLASPASSRSVRESSEDLVHANQKCGPRHDVKINTDILASVLNGQHCYVEFAVFLDHKTKQLTIHITEESHDKVKEPNALAEPFTTRSIDVMSIRDQDTTKSDLTAGYNNDDTVTPKSGQNTKASDQSEEKHAVTFREDMHELQTKVENSHAMDDEKVLAGTTQEMSTTDISNHNIDIDPNQHTALDMIFLTSCTTSFPLCENDRLRFYFDNNKSEQQKVLKLAEIQNGRRVTLKMSINEKKSHTRSNAKTPKKIVVRREIIDETTEQTVCELNLQARAFVDDNPLRDQTTQISSRITHALNRIRGKLIQTVDVRQLLDGISHQCVFTFEQQYEIRKQKTPQKRADVFLAQLATHKLPDVRVVCSALEAQNDGLAQELRLLLGM